MPIGRAGAAKRFKPAGSENSRLPSARPKWPTRVSVAAGADSRVAEARPRRARLDRQHRPVGVGQACAELVVLADRPQGPSRSPAGSAARRRGERGLALQDQRHDAADMRGRDRGARRRSRSSAPAPAPGYRRRAPPPRYGCRGSRPRRACRSRRSPTPRSRSGSAAGYCGGRLRPEIAGGGDQHDAARARRLQASGANRRIGRAREAHVDDARVLRHGVVDALEDRERGGLDAAAAWRRTRGSPGCARPARPRISRERAAIVPAIAVPWVCGFSVLLSASKVPAITPRNSGCDGVDAGIDHRDQHVVAARQAVRLLQPQLGQRVLRRIADRRRHRPGTQRHDRQRPRRRRLRRREGRGRRYAAPDCAMR